MSLSTICLGFWRWNDVRGSTDLLWPDVLLPRVSDKAWQMENLTCFNSPWPQCLPQIRIWKSQAVRGTSSEADWTEKVIEILCPWHIADFVTAATDNLPERQRGRLQSVFLLATSIQTRRLLPTLTWLKLIFINEKPQIETDELPLLLFILYLCY